jgi:formylglycine-generating enzyme
MLGSRIGSCFILILLCPMVAAQGVRTAEPEPEWVRVPAGEFMMGSHVAPEKIADDFKQYGRRPEYFSDEFPQHKVRITKPFLISATEVTVGQFRAFVVDSGYITEAERDGTGGWGFDPAIGKCVGRDRRFSWRDAGYPQTDQHPVVNVSWNDCVAYCAWLSKKANRAIRLPTEAEWEYACRAGSVSYYALGDSENSILNHARTLKPTEDSIRHAVQDLQLAEAAATVFPVPVGSYAPNRFGLYDMHGNVWEWTADWHADDYYAHSPSDDPKGPSDGGVKVRRGGGWNTFPLWARASFRNWNSIESRCINLGFRVLGELRPIEID